MRSVVQFLGSEFLEIGNAASRGIPAGYPYSFTSVIHKPVAGSSASNVGANVEACACHIAKVVEQYGYSIHPSINRTGSPAPAAISCGNSSESANIWEVRPMNLESISPGSTATKSCVRTAFVWSIAASAPCATVARTGNIDSRQKIAAPVG